MKTPTLELKTQYPCLRISGLALLDNPEFGTWLNSGVSRNHSGPATWHRAPAPVGEFSDLFLWKDQGTEGSDSDMPGWQDVCRLVGSDFVGVIWIDFVELS